MKKNARRTAAVLALTAIAVLTAVFTVSAFTAAPGESGNRFMALLFCVVAIPILAWLLLFCIGRMQNKQTMAELFPEQEERHGKNTLKAAEKK